ncbi:MAG: hypothetical protein ACE5EM_02795 [Sphingomonadales bacterium]
MTLSISGDSLARAPGISGNAPATHAPSTAQRSLKAAAQPAIKEIPEPIGKYDLTSITADELAEFGMALFQAGQVTLAEVLGMSMPQLHERMEAAIEIGPDIIRLTPPSPNGESFNVLAYLEQEIALRRENNRDTGRQEALLAKLRDLDHFAKTGAPKAVGESD